jgi:hypothetical protein
VPTIMRNLRPHALRRLDAVDLIFRRKFDGFVIYKNCWHILNQLSKAISRRGAEVAEIDSNSDLRTLCDSA